MQFRSFVSILLSMCFWGTAITGVLKYIFIHNDQLSAFHVIFGFAMIVMVLAHIFNNFRPIKNYYLEGKYRISLIVGTVLFVVVLLGSAFQFPPFGEVIRYGEHLRHHDEVEKKVEYVIKTNQELEGIPVTVDIRAGKEFKTPQMAIWVEDEAGKFVETIYVSMKSGKGSYWNPDPNEERRRPEALPVWSHRRNVTEWDGGFMPSKKNPMSDAVTGATPKASFQVVSKFEGEQKRYKLFVEINMAMDFNEYYSKSRFPEDSVYSKSPSGQPSLIYEAEIRPGELSVGRLVGHGHHSGATGELYGDLSKIDTAKEILKGVVIEAF